MRSDINVVAETISINKSRHLGVDNQPKTQKSRRIIRVPLSLVDALLTLPSFAVGVERVFLNKFGDPLDAGQWAKDYWPRVLKALGIRHRRFYCTRHTFITEAVKRGELLKAIGDYCGTSVAMIEASYCETLILSDLTVFEPRLSKYPRNLASPTGFEPGRIAA
jgi:integrase